MHYIAATAIAIIISTFSNWAFGRLLTFRNAQKQNAALEIGKVYLVSAAGLLMNVALMWVFVEKLALAKMAAKMLATCAVFCWNYFSRKIFVYREK